MYFYKWWLITTCCHHCCLFLHHHTSTKSNHVNPGFLFRWHPKNWGGNPPIPKINQASESHPPQHPPYFQWAGQAGHKFSCLPFTKMPTSMVQKSVEHLPSRFPGWMNQSGLFQQESPHSLSIRSSNWLPIAWEYPLAPTGSLNLAENRSFGDDSQPLMIIPVTSWYHDWILISYSFYRL